MSLGIADKVIELGGGRIQYAETGSGDKTLVFIHGAGGFVPSRHHSEFMTRLGESFRVLAPSLPGFDESTPGEETITALAEAIAVFIEKTCDGPVVIIGQSFGSRVALWLTINHPELVESLVLSGPAALSQRPPAPPPGSPPPAAPTSEQLHKRLYGDVKVVHTPEETALMAKNAAQSQRFSQPSRDELLVRMPEIEALTLVLFGTEDAMASSPDAGAAVYQRTIPHAYSMYLYAAAHELPVIAAERYAALIEDFAKRGEAFIVNHPA